MTTPSSALSLTELRNRVSFDMGYGRTYTDHSSTSNEKYEIDDAIKDGLRMFYYPPAIDGLRKQHEWSFLTPTATITTDGDYNAHPSAANTTTITAADATFNEDMIGRTLTFAESDTSYTVTGYTSATVITIDSTAVGETTATGTVSGAQSTTVTSSTAVFTSDMVGRYLSFAGGIATFHKITAVTSTLVCTVSVSAVGGTGAITVWDEFTIADNGQYLLPQGVAHVIGDMTYDQDDGWTPIKSVGEQHIMRQRMFNTGKERPVLFAVRVVNNSNNQDYAVDYTRYEVMFHPRPNAAYTVYYKHSFLAEALAAGTYDYPYGGDAHGDTIIKACKAAGEFNDKDGHGPKYEAFMSALRTSIQRDRNIAAPDSILTRRGSWPRWNRQDMGVSKATYGGVQY